MTAQYTIAVREGRAAPLRSPFASGSEMRAMRQQIGLTQEQLAELLGVCRMTIQRQEQRRMPHVWRLAMLALRDGHR